MSRWTEIPDPDVRSLLAGYFGKVDRALASLPIPCPLAPPQGMPAQRYDVLRGEASRALAASCDNPIHVALEICRLAIDMKHLRLQIRSYE